MKCPICQSEDIKVELRSAGTTSKSNYYRTGIKKSWFIPAGQKTHKSERNYKSIAICQNCGHHWETNTGDGGCITTIIGWIILIIIIVSIFRACSIVIGARNGDSISNSTNGTQATSIWASDYTPLSDFDYYIDEESIHIRECTSRSKTIYIAPSYMVDGRELPVVSIEDSRAFRRSDSIIISEGITEIARAAFNGCRVKYLYLPSTLTDFDGWSYFHDVEKLYYGGSEESWTEIYSYERSRLDVVEVICNASISELLSME